MKLRIVTSLLLVSVVLGSTTRPSAAQDHPQTPSTERTPATPKGPTLNIGDPAPPITIDTWLKGAPVPELKKGNTYVVEFWATWCGPCKISIPHLTEVQKKYKAKNVTVIGVAASERGAVDMKAFVAGFGDKMDYTVGWDQTQATYLAWMQAAGQNAIPTAFVVNGQGEVAWIGHPMYPEGEMEKVLDAVAANTYDVKAAAERSRKVRDATIALQKAGNSKPPDTTAVLTALDILIENDSVRRDQYSVTKLNILLFMKKDYDAGYALAAQLVDGSFKDNAVFLEGLASAILNEESLQKRDLDLALRSATRANDLTAGKDPKMLNTVAKASFEKGAVAKAVEFQTAAIALVTDEAQKKEFQESLDKYQAAAKN